ncbi:MAG: alpha/beta hydrolase-fold protein [Leptospiraceae bacterium]|nr:alpha/beta hydrolase-fold protein [Leptospiraceae bacterium]
MFYLVLAITAFFVSKCASIQNLEIQQRVLEGQSIEVDARKRNYIVFTPSHYSSKKKYPLVFILHGAKGSPIGMQNMTQFNKIAEREGIILVYPFGTTHDKKIGYFWNAWECCGYALQHEVNDIKFFQRLVEVLSEEYSINKNQIFVLGFSNGGMMSLKLACDATELFRGVASVGGAMFHENCKPKKPIPVFLIQGGKDEVVPVKGGVGKNSSTPSAKLPSYQTFQFWFKKNACKRERSVEEKTLSIAEGLECNQNGRVKMVIVKEEAHTWPEENYPASEEIWKFFQQELKAEEFPS